MSTELFFLQLRNELWKLFGRKRTYLGFAVFLPTELLIAWLWHHPILTKPIRSLLANNGLSFEAYSGGLSLATFSIVLTVALIAGLYLTLVAGDLMAKELEDGTLRMVLARPVSRPQIFFIKALVGVIHTLLLMLFIGLSSLAVGLVCGGGLGDLLVLDPLNKVFAAYGSAEGLGRYLLAIGAMALTYQTVSALALMCSCMKLRPATATVLSLSVLYVDFAFNSIPFLAAYKGWLLSHHLSCWVLFFRYSPPWHSIAISMLVLVGLTVSFWMVGLALFCGRDVKT